MEKNEIGRGSNVWLGVNQPVWIHSRMRWRYLLLYFQQPENEPYPIGVENELGHSIWAPQWIQWNLMIPPWFCGTESRPSSLRGSPFVALKKPTNYRCLTTIIIWLYFKCSRRGRLVWEKALSTSPCRLNRVRNSKVIVDRSLMDILSVYFLLMISPYYLTHTVYIEKGRAIGWKEKIERDQWMLINPELNWKTGGGKKKVATRMWHNTIQTNSKYRKVGKRKFYINNHHNRHTEASVCV